MAGSSIRSRDVDHPNRGSEVRMHPDSNLPRHRGMPEEQRVTLNLKSAWPISGVLNFG